MDQVIITAALTGAVTPKAKNAHIPITPEEIAADAYACWKAGAAMVHLHMRADDGLGAMDKEKFRETIRLIRSHQDCDVIINCTSSGASAEHPATDEERMAHHQELEGIEMGSYDAGTFNWMPGGVFVNSPQFLEKLGDLYMEKGIKPELEIFDAGMIYNTLYYLKKGVLKAPCHYQIVLGCAGGMTSTVENLAYLKNLLPEGSTWAGCGISSGHLPIMMATIAMGGHLRVGLEDNLYLDHGVLAKSNAQLVERAVQLLALNNLEPATPEEARKIYGLTRKVF